jgi:hypothetical protein
VARILILNKLELTSIGARSTGLGGLVMAAERPKRISRFFIEDSKSYYGVLYGIMKRSIDWTI